MKLKTPTRHPDECRDLIKNIIYGSRNKFGMTTMVIILTFLLLTFTQPAFASEDLGASRLNPDSPFYFLKTVREEIEWKIALTPKVKIIRQLEFAARRLRETKGLFLDNHQELIPATIQRYLAILKSIPEYDSSNAQMLAIVSEAISMQEIALENIYSKLEDAKAKMAIRAAVNAISKREDLSKRPKLSACNFLSHEASASASIKSGSVLTEVEKAILIKRARSCFSSLKL